MLRDPVGVHGVWVNGVQVHDGKDYLGRRTRARRGADAVQCLSSDRLGKMIDAPPIFWPRGLALPFGLLAQTRDRPARIGWLAYLPLPDPGLDMLREGLRELGYREGVLLRRSSRAPRTRTTSARRRWWRHWSASASTCW